jgi:hypothetical protein
MDGGQPIPSDEIGAHLGKQEIILQQVIEYDQHRIGLVLQLGHAGKDVFGWVAVNQPA